MTPEERADQGVLFLGGDPGGLDLDGIGPGLPTTPLADLDLPRLLAPGVIAYPTEPKDA